MSNIKEKLMKELYKAMHKDSLFNSIQILNNEVVTKWQKALQELSDDGYIHINHQSVINEPISRLKIEGKITHKGLEFIKKLEVEK